MTAEELVNALVDFLGGGDDLLEVLDEACCMDDPNPKMVELRDVMKEMER